MRSKIRFDFNTWRKSLVGQLLLRFWVCHIIFFSTIGVMQYHSLKNSLYQSVEQNLLSDYNSIRDSMINWLVNSDLPPGRFAELRPGNFVAFYTIDNNLRFMVQSYGRLDSILPPFMQKDLEFDLFEKAQSSQPFVIGNAKEGKYMLVVKPVLAAKVPSVIEQYIENPSSILRHESNSIQIASDMPILGYALVGEPLKEEDSILARNLQGYVFNALLIVLLSTLLTALALQKPLEPLLNISSTARKIAGGQYNLRLPNMKTASEIEQLREALNHMLEQMENALNTEKKAKERMSQFIADASHELRTPLTSIRGFLEILQRTGTTDKETLDSAHKTMLIETERLIRLTEQLLTLTRISQEGLSQEQSTSYLSSLQEVLPELLPLISPMLKNKVLKINNQDLGDISDFSTLSTVTDEERFFPLKTDELKQILYNLLSNAFQHTKAGGIIELNTFANERSYSLMVKDNGQGIPPEDLPHIFERFFQGDRSRTHAQGQGSGLGLAIVSELVKVRGGKIEVESTLGKGTTFRLTFPLAKSGQEEGKGKTS
ncbi:MAG TPA: HAMP domain-containing histidine kinase [Peptococcaceae bacterium]|nr:HAMP domain-containing histidine kinase [Peptococcaceae bacterium]